MYQLATVTQATHRLISSAAGRIHLVEQGAGPLVLLVHGFPESWYSWRHQLPVLAAAGNRAVAVDVRGYGRSSKPEGAAAYRMLDLAEDNVAVVHALGEQSALILGHDWGSTLAANSSRLRPGRGAFRGGTAGCVGRCSAGRGDRLFLGLEVFSQVRTGGRQVGAGDGQKRGREHAGGDVPVPGRPFTDLVLIQAEQVLAVLVVLLDLPPHAGDYDQFRDGGGGCGVGQEVLDVDGLGSAAAS